MDNRSFPSGESSHDLSHSSLAYKVIAPRPRVLLVTASQAFMQPLSFLLLIASLAFALPAKSAEHKLLSPDNFGKTIAKGYW